MSGFTLGDSGLTHEYSNVQSSNSLSLDYHSESSGLDGDAEVFCFTRDASSVHNKSKRYELVTF
ncbi:hypothetical protein [Legionella worsleiensis]|uniref:hypothetical protein n=1 Tax=Legionella worsleiensis TaxID=45076 RepID=UPI0011C04113|nr:hypothetical protein [Legionella worsleiensis]